MPPNTKVELAQSYRLGEELWTSISQFMDLDEWACAAGTCKASWNAQVKDVRVVKGVGVPGHICLMQLSCHSISLICTPFICPFTKALPDLNIFDGLAHVVSFRHTSILTSSFSIVDNTNLITVVVYLDIDKQRWHICSTPA